MPLMDLVDSKLVSPDGFGVLSRELIIMFSYKKGGLLKKGVFIKTHNITYIMKWPAWEGVYFREFWGFWIFKILFSENAEQNFYKDGFRRTEFFLKDGFRRTEFFHKDGFRRKCREEQIPKMHSTGINVIKGWALSRGNHLGNIKTYFNKIEV